MICSFSAGGTCNRLNFRQRGTSGAAVRGYRDAREKPRPRSSARVAVFYRGSGHDARALPLFYYCVGIAGTCTSRYG